MSASLTLDIITSLQNISDTEWDACVSARHPFSSYAFLHALEASSSATTETGWASHHFALRDQDGALVALLPCYLKNHSYGEYVFDHNWAEALYAAGGRYYPKLQSSIPFTPATCHKILVKDEGNRADITSSLLRAIGDYVDQSGISSFHATFLPDDEASHFSRNGFSIRHDIQYHWDNNSYVSFQEFLAALNSRKRKAIRKERDFVFSLGLDIEPIEGSQIEEKHWDAFFEFYQDTGSRKWGRPYLTREFFSFIGQTMKDEILLFMCKSDGSYIAGALNFKGTDTLYGRHWGAIQHERFLHFELCYYQAIDYAIQHGFKRVEAGAQGQHKIARGYLPRITKSAHYLREPAFKSAVDQFLENERAYIDATVSALRQHSPFRQTNGQN